MAHVLPLPACRMDFSVLERLPTKNPDTLRDLLAEVQQPADRRLAGTVTPLNNADKEAVRQRLDALDHKRLCQQQQQVGGGSAGTGGALPPTAVGGAGAPTPAANGTGPHHSSGGSYWSGAAAGRAVATAPLPPPPPVASPHLVQQWLPPTHSVALARQRAKAEQKRLLEQHHRAQQRAAAIREYLHRKLDGLQQQQAAAQAAGSETVGRLLCETARLPLSQLGTAVAQLASSRELTPADAELATANLRRLQGKEEGEGEQRHVWYGDTPPILGSSTVSSSMSSSGLAIEVKHEARGYDEMEQLLMEQQRHDWQMFDHAGQLVCRDVEGWQSVVSTLLTRPVGSLLAARLGGAFGSSRPELREGALCGADAWPVQCMHAVHNFLPLFWHPVCVFPPPRRMPPPPAGPAAGAATRPLHRQLHS